jgi:hypothetical protein
VLAYVPLLLGVGTLSACFTTRSVSSGDDASVSTDGGADSLATGSGGSGSAGRSGGEGGSGLGGSGGSTTSGSGGAPGSPGGSGGGGAAAGSGGAAPGSGGAPGAGGAGRGSGGAAPGSGGAPGAGGAGACRTSISGTVRDPAGRLPLYGAAVYVPALPLDPVVEGVSCDPCGTRVSGRPITSTATDVRGQFRLEGVPPGADVPLVVQVGKWRRLVTLPQIAACADNPISDANLTRLPRSASEGNLPRIAVVTGAASAPECLLRRIGVADSEFTNDAGTGRVHLYAGGSATARGATQLASGATFSDAYAALFSNPARLASYDMVMLACEGEQLEGAKSPYLANVKAYADKGGRLLAEHHGSYWVRSGAPPWPATSDWTLGGQAIPNPVEASIDTSFPKGAAFSEWLSAVGASATPGRIPLTGAENSFAAVTPPAQRWIYLTSPVAAPQLLTFGTPVEAPPASQCGRVELADFHTEGSSIGSSSPDQPFPSGCQTASAPEPQEKALEFLFFDTPPCAGGSGPPVPGGDSLAGRSVLMVVESPLSPDQGEVVLRQDLQSRGMTVTMVDGGAPASAAAGHHLVLVLSADLPETFGATFRDVPVPMVVLGNQFNAALGFAGTAATNRGSVDSSTPLTIVDASTPLSADLAAATTFTAISAARDTSLYWGIPGGSPIRVAAAAASASQVMAFAFEKGAAMASGTAAARRVALGWRATTVQDLTIPSYKLTLAAIRWTATAPP